jgi:hypothetical protein
MGVGNNYLLRQRRLDGKLTIDEVVRRTKLPRAYVELIDEGRVAELPPGLYGRSYVRAYAAAVGVSADEALACYAAELVDVPDPLPALREIAREQTPPTLAAAIADRVREWYVTREDRPRERRAAFRLAGAAYLAAALDAALLFTINAFVAGVAANACQVPVDLLLRTAGAAVAVMCAFTCVMYFALLAGVGGQTLGMRVCRVHLRAERRPMSLRAIGARAVEAALGESSILVDWVCTAQLPTRRESPV